MADDKTKTTQSKISPETRTNPPRENTVPTRREIPVPSPAAKTKPRSAKAAPDTAKNTWREIVETVVFVVVLVLLLKSFVAEAFVIPTGSMAETLYGYQKWVKCPQCDFEFPVNCSDEVERKIPITGCTCPNCRWEIAFRRAENVNDIKEIYDPRCDPGDRVLVAKYLGDAQRRLLDFERFDVVVFKFPEEPQLDYEAKNYIKRLIGLPGETIGIYQGDLYLAKDIPYDRVRLVRASPPERRLVVTDLTNGSETTLEMDPDVQIFRDEAPIRIEDLQELNQLEKPENRDQGIISKATREGKFLVTRIQVYSKNFPVRRQMYRNSPAAMKLLQEPPSEGVEPRFHILRKSPAKILAVRRSVYDNNHPARDLIEANFPPRWAAEKDAPGLAPKDFRNKRARASDQDAWKAGNAHDFQHPARPGNEIDWLRYRHLIRRSNADPGTPELKSITDFIGYNQIQKGNWVGDLILEFKIDVKENEGDLILELCKGADRFQARWQLANGLCTLVRHGKDGQDEELKKEQTSLKKPGTYKVRFANVDQRLTIWVDGSLPFGDGVAYDPPADRNDEERNPNDLEPASIGVRAADARIRDLTLWRDTYYTDGPMTLYVQPGHYLCLGDNSPQSSDSRSWGPTSQRDDKGGLVPERLMLGRALLVYWPYYRAGTIR